MRTQRGPDPGDASGASSMSSRWRFRTASATRADVPSGATSFLAEEKEVLVERRAVEAEGACIILALVERQPAVSPEIPGIARCETESKVTRHLPPGAARPGFLAQRLLRKVPFLHLSAFLRWAGFDPSPVARLQHVAGRIELPEPDPQPGPRDVARHGASQPVVPPAERQMLEPDRGTGVAVIGIVVSPGSDDAPDEVRPRVGQRHHGVGIAVGPAAHGEDGAREPLGRMDHRPPPPVRAPRLLAHPVFQGKRERAEPCLPPLAPVFADVARWRQRENRRQRRAPFERVGEEAAALVMDVVLVPVMGRADRDHGRECLGCIDARLQARGAAPGGAEHADPTVAPRLRREPFDHRPRVRQLVLRVHVGHVALAVAGAPHVDPRAGVTVPRQEGMVPLVARPSHVALAVRDVLQNRRNRRVPGT